MIQDLELSKNLDMLFDRKIYIYGAAENGFFVQSSLEDMGIDISGFFDSNKSLWGNTIHGKKVFSRYRLYDLMCADDALLIVATISGKNEVVSDIIDEGIDTNKVYTLYGFFFGLYFNYKKIFMIKPDLQSKYADFFTMYAEAYRIRSRYEQQNMPYQGLRHLLLNDTPPIIINQPGKVGSNTIMHTLRRYGIYNIRIHGLAYPFEYNNSNSLNIFKERLSAWPKVKMITLIRDPIGKDYGHFFQKLSLQFDMAWYAKGIAEDCFQTSFLNYLSVITPFDFTEKRSELQKDIFCHIDMIGKNSPLGSYYGWYDEELKKHLDIDILQCDFNKEKGYGIISKKNIELLVLRLDKLNFLEDILGEFLEVGKINLVNANMHDEKDYSFVYQDFRNEVFYPKKYVDFYYRDNPYTEHFFNLQEIDKLRNTLAQRIK